MKKPWDETRRAFRLIALRIGITRVAREMNVNRMTVYRIMDGETMRPHPITQDRIETIVREHQEELRT